MVLELYNEQQYYNFGYGTGISKAVAHKFGKEGYKIGLVARNAQKLEKAILELKAQGIEAYAFACDLAVLEDIPNLIKRIKDQLGEIKIFIGMLSMILKAIF